MHPTSCFCRTPLAQLVSLVFCGVAGSAAAQTAAPGTERLPDVTVTAQKVAQPASKAPLAITALNGDELRAAGAANAEILTSLVPNVLISQGSSGSTDISIRGIVSTNTTEVGDPAAAFHIDGVYLGRPQSAGAAFYDLERVEVLRGPQGTLYGRNATAGAVNLITKKPTQKLEGEVNVGLGDFNMRNVEAMVNLPAGEALAFRAVVSSTKRDGYLVTAGAPNNFSKNRNDIDNFSARVHALAKLSADTRVLVTLDDSRNQGAGPGSLPLAIYQKETGEAQRTFLGNANEGARNERSQGLSVEVTSNLSFGELTYLGARRTFDRDNIGSTGGVRSTTESLFTQTSHEVRLASNTKGPLQWLTGLYAYDEQGDINAGFFLPNFRISATTVLPVLVQRFIQDPIKSKSTAIFGQATYSLTPDLRVTAGLRSTADEKSRQGVGTFTPAIAPKAINSADVSYRQSTWKLGADYDISKQVLGYASVATGYKAGGYFDGNNASGDNTYKPEFLTSVEAGIKGRFFNNALRMSASVFSYDYKDLQISYVTINPLTNATGTITTNAAKARNTGIEVEGKWAVSDSGTVNFALGLLDAKYDSFIFPVVTGRPTAISYEGKSLDKAPQTTLVLGYTHNWATANGGLISTTISTRYSGSYVLSNFAVATPVQYTQDAFNRTDIRATYTAPNDKWYAEAFVKNLEDRNVMSGYSFSGQTGNQAFLSEPRTMGIRAGVRF